MKKISLFIFAAMLLHRLSALPTNNIPATSKAVQADTNGVVQSPTNFWNANSNSIKTAIGSVGGGSGTDTNALHATNNLSDLTSAATARSSLGLGTAATQPATAFYSSSNPGGYVTQSVTNGLVGAGTVTTQIAAATNGLLATNGNGAAVTNLTATNLTGAIATINVTNTVISSDGLHIYVSNSSQTNLNAVYTFFSTNSGTGQAIWSNAVNHYILYLNDPGDNWTGFATWVLEATPNDDNAPYYNANSAITSGWDANTATGTNILQASFGTNIVTTVYPFIAIANAVPAGVKPVAVITDPVYGNDATATATTNFAFRTLNAASLSPLLASGGTINMVCGTYADTGTIVIPPNVIVNGNHSVFTNINLTLQIQSGCTLNDVSMLGGTVGIPGSQYATNVVFNDVYAHGTIDGCYFYSLGTVDIINCDFGSGWDALAVFQSTNWSVLRIFNSKFTCVRVATTPESTGMHGIVWTPNVGGKLQIFNSQITIYNPTNTPYVDQSLNGNAGLMLGYGTSYGTNSFGNTSVEIYNTVFSHGTTNAGASAPAIYNAANVPISGNWTDVTLGTNQFGTTNTGVFVQVQKSTNTVPTVGNSLLFGAFSFGTPANSSATNYPGAIGYDASYLYLWTATNVNKRVAFSTW